ncbi:hypothetical protein HAX54_048872, partial [Datura stramonium]|nr:hypothetical protein [Datura stramonium]
GNICHSSDSLVDGQTGQVVTWNNHSSNSLIITDSIFGYFLNTIQQPLRMTHWIFHRVVPRPVAFLKILNGDLSRATQRLLFIVELGLDCSGRMDTAVHHVYPSALAL